MRRLLIVSSVLGVLLTLPSPARAMTLYYNMGSPALNTWSDVNILLQEPGWRVDNYLSGAAATSADFNYVLANLSGFYILTEWNSGPDDTNVDNVSFGTAASSSFTSTNEGWKVAGPTPTADIIGQSWGPGFGAAWESFGNPAGSLTVGDHFFWTWVQAPSLYLGNQSAQYGNTLSFDIFLRFTDNVTYPMVALVAPDTPAAVPEPASLMLLGTGLMGLAARRARRARRRSIT